VSTRARSIAARIEYLQCRSETVLLYRHLHAPLPLGLRACACVTAHSCFSRSNKCMSFSRDGLGECTPWVIPANTAVPSR